MRWGHQPGLGKHLGELIFQSSICGIASTKNRDCPSRVATDLEGYITSTKMHNHDPDFVDLKMYQG